MKSDTSQFQVDENSGIPLWSQVRKRLIFLIVSGYYQPGDQLPTVRELAVQLDINYNTVNKVYQILEREGYVVTRRGRGTFVAELDDKTLLTLDNKVDLLADELVEQGFDFGMTGDEILRTVKNRIDQYVRHNSGKSAGTKTAGVQAKSQADSKTMTAKNKAV